MNARPLPIAPTIPQISSEPLSQLEINQLANTVNLLSQKVTNLLATAGNLQHAILSIQRILNSLTPSSYVTVVNGTANQVSVGRSGGTATVSLTSSVVISGNMQAASYNVGATAGASYAGSGGNPTFVNGIYTGGNFAGGSGTVGDVPTNASGTDLYYTRVAPNSSGSPAWWQIVGASNGITVTTSGGTMQIALANPLTVGTINSGTWNGTAVGIAYGGTGAATAATAFSALTPTTTKGDITYCSVTSGNVNTRLAIGSTGQALIVASGIPSWGTLGVAGGGTGQTNAASAFNALSPTASVGDIIYCSASSGNVNSRLVVGSTGQVLNVSGGLPAWTGAVSVTTVTAATSFTVGPLVMTKASSTVGEIFNNSVLAIGFDSSGNVTIEQGLFANNITVAGGSITFGAGGHLILPTS